ncbi:glycosyltransferase family 2 protein [Candidatus Gottesmanbacteria bacterium]|nr:glycosyltransferase family 2 protein [Candidatus Gottesmanbacteria bacterium]
MDIDVSIIIVSFNTKKLTEDCLTSTIRSLKESKLRWEIIVVDNISEDGTREMLKKKFPMVKTILNTENVGFGRGNNQGIKAAKGEYILLLNSDTVILNNAIGKLVSFGRQHPNAFIGPKLLNPDRTPQSSCGPFFTLPVVFASLFLKGDYIGLTRWSPNRARKVDWVSGACILAPKKLFMQNLLFDEQIFMYMEEIDLLMRAKRQGYATYFYPRSLIVHLGAASSTNKRKGPVLNIYRGFIYLYKKHGTPFSLGMVRMMLKTKAILAWLVGVALGKGLLKETYEEAYRMV